MSDIAAFLSLKPAAPGIDPALIQGMETADIQAFGSILASQVDSQAGVAAPSLSPSGLFASALATTVPVAGQRQASGNILPDGLPVGDVALPDNAGGAEVLPAVPELPMIVIAKAAVDKLPAKAGLAELLGDRGGQAEAEPANDKPAEAPILAARVFAAAVSANTKRAAGAKAGQDTATDPAAESPADAPQIAANADLAFLAMLPADPAIPAQSIDPALIPAVSTIALPSAPAPAASAEATSPTATSPTAISIVALATAQTAATTQAALAVQTSAQPGDAAPQPTAAPMPVLVVSEPGAEAPATTPITVTVAPASIQAPAPQSTSSRFRIVTAPSSGETQVQGAATVQTVNVAQPTPVQPLHLQPVAQAQAGAAIEQPVAEAAAASVGRSAAKTGAEVESPLSAAFQPTTVSTDLQSAGQSAGSTVTAATPALAATANRPGHDFAGLVDRLIEARDAAASQSAPQSITAAVDHAEFGKVSLHFQQDAGGLSVAMSSPDPDFKPAVQAAQAAASADRGTDNSSQQNQAQNQNQYQSGGQATLAQNGSRGQGTEGQPRTAQDRNERSGANPSQSSRDEGGTPDRRSGIFA